MIPLPQIPLSERPRERCLSQGAKSLSLRECLALILGIGPRGKGCLGLAQEILERPGKGLGEDEIERAFFLAMDSTPQAHLQEIPGLGDSQRARILAAFELGRRYAYFRQRPSPAPHGRRSLKSLPARALNQIPTPWIHEPKEWFGFVPCYPHQRLGEFCVVERGVRTHVNVDPVELFARILALRPQGFYVFHNHPSGDLAPSLQDEDLTRRVVRLAQQLGVQFYGHGIVSPLGSHWVVV